MCGDGTNDAPSLSQMSIAVSTTTDGAEADGGAEDPFLLYLALDLVLTGHCRRFERISVRIRIYCQRWSADRFGQSLLGYRPC